MIDGVYAIVRLLLLLYGVILTDAFEMIRLSLWAHDMRTTASAVQNGTAKLGNTKRATLIVET